MLSGELLVLHAGSLSAPLERLCAEFEALHPGLRVRRVAGGSAALARDIASGRAVADLFLSADIEVVEQVLVPEHAERAEPFAGNEMVLCHTDASRHADRIGPDDWFRVLSEPGVAWGHSDPDLDPCGYRALMVLQLAEIFHDEPGLAARLLASRRPENVLPRASDLVVRLLDGSLDYAWEYRSVAVQRGLRFVALDPRVNLGDPRLNEVYAQAVVRTAGARPGETIERRGAACVYALALCRRAPNPAAARAFIPHLRPPFGGL